MFIAPHVDVVLFFVAIIAGFVDTVAGGGGIVTLPALLFFNVPPIFALSTNRFQGLVGELTASYYFSRKGGLKLSAVWPVMISAGVGSAVGTVLVQSLSNDFLQKIIPLLLLIVLSYSILSGRLFKSNAGRMLNPRTFALIFGLGIGFYNGFFGPGTGSFWVLAFFLFQGMSLQVATVHAKPANMAGNIVSFLFFLSAGHFLPVLALSMALGQFVGANIGARMVVFKGLSIIRPVLTIVVLLMTLELLLRALGT